jgi:integrase/recombinase XerC
MHAVFSDFLDHLRLVQKSPSTVRRYARVLDELGRHSELAVLATISPDDLRRFAAAPLLDGRARSPAGVNLRVAVVKGAFSYAHAQGVIEAIPAASLSRVRLPRRTPKYLTTAEVSTLLRHVASRRSRNRLRDLALVLVIWQTGLRVSEVARLRWWQVERGRRLLSDVLLKGGHVLDVDVNDETLGVLLGLGAWTKADRTSAVFARYDGHALSVRAIESLFEVWRAELGWTRRLHPHVLRHAHATGQRADGARIETVADSLHHADLRTVQVYATVQNPELRAALRLLGRHVPREILNEFDSLRAPDGTDAKSPCEEPSFHEPCEAA